MRFLVGILSILLLLPAAVLAQASGEVEKIGFENFYRPDCWTPMTVRLVPDTAKSEQFQIQVKQEDLDRDHPIFSRLISLTGNAEGKGREQRFRVYFKPQPTNDGLPDAYDPTRSGVQDLEDALPVSLASSTGKWLAPLKITSTIVNLDPKTGAWSDKRGARLVLAVSDGRSAPVWREYQQCLGLLENITFVTVQPRDLPESVLGYDCVDSVLWLDADPSVLKSGGDEKFRALESYVRRGGNLVLCAPAEWQKMLAFGEMLPVVMEGTAIKQDPEPLRAIVREQMSRRQSWFSSTILSDGTRQRNRWEEARGPFTLVRADARPGSIIDEWIVWDEAKNDRTPWLVRKPFGAGGVTWVAQDLGDGFLTKQAPQGSGWAYIWDRVFDWKNDTLILRNETSDSEKAPYAPAAAVDVGYSILGIDLGAKSLGLMTLAIVFFIGYWLLAGPGVYAYLATKRQTTASWFWFAITALAATGVTVAIVRLTLRGAPELRHISLVRAASGEPAYVYSRFGLYIPRDGMQTIELKGMVPDSVAAISAFGIHPQHLEGAPEDPGPEYTVAVRDAASAEPASIRVPYRSTIKKFEADWTGDITGRIEGSGTLTDARTFIQGTITNGTGRRLRNIYIAFRYPSDDSNAGDWILYRPSWEPGVALDLAREFNFNEDGKRLDFGFFGLQASRSPDRAQKVRGKIANDWQPYWFSTLRGQSIGERRRDDSQYRVKASIPMFSFFQRLAPAKNPSGLPPDRFELLRRGARKYDVSPALASGALVVLAEADDDRSPLPMPLEVQGDRIDGWGTTYYQFVLPLDTTLFSHPPATQPSGE